MWAHIFALCAGAITNRATVETHRGWVGSRDSLLSDTLWQTTSKQSTQSMCCVYQLSKRLHVIKRVLIFRAGAAAQPHQGALAAHMHSRRRSVPACNRFESNSLARSNAALPATSRAASRVAVRGTMLALQLCARAHALLRSCSQRLRGTQKRQAAHAQPPASCGAPPRSDQGPFGTSQSCLQLGMRSAEWCESA